MAELTDEEIRRSFIEKLVERTADAIHACASQLGASEISTHAAQAEQVFPTRVVQDCQRIYATSVFRGCRLTMGLLAPPN